MFEAFFKQYYITFKILSDVAITAIAFVGLVVVIIGLIYVIGIYRYVKGVYILLKPYQK